MKRFKGAIIMEMLVLWFGTIIVSFCTEIANELRVVKDVVDAGYKIDMERMLELEKQINPSLSKTSNFMLLVPIFNIMKVFEKVIQYNNMRPMVLEELNAIDALLELSEREKQEYLRKPTMFRALLIQLKSDMGLNKTSYIKITDGDEVGEIFFEYGQSLDDITVLKASGVVSKLTEEEQKQKVMEAMIEVAHSFIAAETKEFVEEVRRNDDANLSTGLENEKEDFNESPKLNIEEQKQALEELKEVLLKEKQESCIEDHPTLTKKNK